MGLLSVHFNYVSFFNMVNNEITQCLVTMNPEMEIPSGKWNIKFINSSGMNDIVTIDIMRQHTLSSMIDMMKYIGFKFSKIISVCKNE